MQVVVNMSSFLTYLFTHSVLALLLFLRNGSYTVPFQIGVSYSLFIILRIWDEVHFLSLRTELDVLIL